MPWRLRRRGEWQKQPLSSAQTTATRLYDHLGFLREQKKQAEADLLREARFTAVIAGDVGVPVVFVSGDQTACREIKDLIGRIEMAQIPDLGPTVVVVLSQ